MLFHISVIVIKKRLKLRIIIYISHVKKSLSKGQRILKILWILFLEYLYFTVQGRVVICFGSAFFDNLHTALFLLNLFLFYNDLVKVFLSLLNYFIFILFFLKPFLFKPFFFKPFFFKPLFFGFISLLFLYPLLLGLLLLYSFLLGLLFL